MGKILKYIWIRKEEINWFRDDNYVYRKFKNKQSFWIQVNLQKSVGLQHRPVICRRQMWDLYIEKKIETLLRKIREHQSKWRAI